MWGTIIAGLAMIASASISAGLSSKQARETGAKAIKLAETKRQDELSEANRNNKLEQGRINLGNEQLSFQKDLLNKKIGMNKEQETYTTNVANKQNMTNSVQNLLKTKDEDWLYKGKLLGRF